VHTEQGVNKRIKDSWGHPGLLPVSRNENLEPFTYFN
jgi:hypothetical protein